MDFQEVSVICSERKRATLVRQAHHDNVTPELVEGYMKKSAINVSLQTTVLVNGIIESCMFI